MPLLLGMPHDRNGDPQVKGDAIYFQTFPGGGSGYTLKPTIVIVVCEGMCTEFLTPCYQSTRGHVHRGLFPRLWDIHGRYTRRIRCMVVHGSRCRQTFEIRHGGTKIEECSNVVAGSYRKEVRNQKFTRIRWRIETCYRIPFESKGCI